MAILQRQQLELVTEIKGATILWDFAIQNDIK